MKRLRVLGISAVCVALAGAAAAQSASRERQAELFAALLVAPDDPALMLDYAQVSIALEDFEAAISTLERALIFSPGDSIVQMELGAAYFRLGSYGAAQAYFEAAKAGDLPPGTLARIDDYLEAIESRTQTSSFSGTLMGGLVYSSNATLGPDDPNVIFGGRPVTIDERFTEGESAGLRASADLRHRYDLGRPNLDAWQTDVSFYTLRFFSEDAGDVDSLGFVTGPSLALDDSAFGPRARPYVGARTVRSGGAPLFYEYGAGSEFSWGVDRHWSVFGRGGVGYRDFLFDQDAFDSVFFRGLAGAAYSPRRGTAFFGALLLEQDSADDEAQTNTEYGFRLNGVHDYAPGIDGVEGLWSLRAYAQVTWRDFSEPDPAIDPTVTREDTDFRVGVSHLFRIKDGVGLQFDVDLINRDSEIENFAFDSVMAGVSAVFEF